MRSASSGNGSASESANRHYMAIHQHPPHTIQTLPNGSRTPVAWQNRDYLSRPPSSVLHHNHAHHIRHHNHRRSARPSSPSVTTTSSEDREEVPMMRHPPRRPNSRVIGNGMVHGMAQTMDRRSLYGHPSHGHPSHGHPQCVPYVGTIMPGEYPTSCHRAIRTGTLRSTKSVPALAMATWDGEPCPIHGQGLANHCPPCFSMATQPMTLRRFGSSYDVRNDKKYSGAGPMYCGPPTLPPPGSPLPPPNIPLHMIAPKYLPRPMVFSTFPDQMSMRDPFAKISSPAPSTIHTKFGTTSDEFHDDACCKGHLVVLWIILGVVTVGVISAIILAVTMN